MTLIQWPESSHRPQVLETKLDPPAAAPSSAVSRAELVARVLEARAPVVVISAPAGYGKTTLLGQCAASAGQPVAWVTLDVSDDDPILLLLEISTALARAVVVDPRILGALLSPEPPTISEMLPRIVNSLAHGRECLIVIDDVHRVHGQDSLAALTFLCEHLPPSVRLIVAGREIPELPLGRLRARGSLLELGPRELAFTRPQARTLLQTEGIDGIDADAFEILYARTEGWPAGLYLAANAAHGSADPNRTLEDFDGNDRDVLEYLAPELLADSDDQRLAFLLHTSVLDRFCAGLCDAILERDDSAAELARLAHSNRFIVSLDRKGEWYRYHHLYGDVLRALLHRQEPTAASIVYERASEWHDKYGEPIDAIEYAFLAHNTRRAAELVAQHLPLLFDHVRETSLQRWLGVFSDVDLDRRPSLAVATAWLRLQVGDTNQTHHCLTIAEHACIEGPLPYSEVSSTSALTLLHGLLGWEGVTKMARTAEAALALEPVGQSAHGLAALATAASLYLRERNAEAEALLAEATPLHQHAGHTLAALGHALGALIAFEERRVADAAASIRDGQALCERAGPHETLATAALAAARARLHVELDDHAAARHDLERAIALIPRSAAIPWWTIQLQIVNGGVATALGELHKARALLEQARRNLTRFPDAGILPRLLAREEHALDCARGGASVLEEPLTQAELRVLALAPTHLTLEEIGNTLHISRNTVKTHLKAIYGKLDVATRGEAVERARALRLLDRLSAAS